jgi:hypothetical protein
VSGNLKGWELAGSIYWDYIQITWQWEQLRSNFKADEMESLKALVSLDRRGLTYESGNSPELGADLAKRLSIYSNMRIKQISLSVDQSQLNERACLAEISTNLTQTLFKIKKFTWSLQGEKLDTETISIAPSLTSLPLPSRFQYLQDLTINLLQLEQASVS